ncbi:adenine-specific methyltransferase EcoRI family protein [Aliarcobacter butzleri]|uniref:Modification methylase n=1 Tax=Aliarcobacter butzleri L351 TaxID=1447259 RepID=A0A837J955_9BACT|nr:adenine-specific methyltransferase EcoRI family protein [Aliarcobacter butzleri]KLE02949.1 modification methylase [Aliarcobacter butzleri L351]KLE12290.1 modification methylase [Aliarcobacter butzleri L350]MDN5073760.1 adenine-specific methyltransferase EcoRI family protein [Aliarcobacter butzleri]MDN5122266.1 adenine-specific methyltransferase EcoRI family protein [Aliarcobacter butzleri]
MNIKTKNSLNRKLTSAKLNKKDEFYTQLTDVERELKHYREHFKGKTIFCNCDDPEWSNFWKYFELNFEFLGIKKLISTHFEEDKSSYKLEIIGDNNFDGKINNLDIVKTPLKENGDFRSKECIEILKEADIVVTNPPFSLFREYVAQLIEYNKKFIVIGHQNAISYREIFQLMKENKIWLGYGFKGGAAHFINKYYENYATATDRKEGMIRVSGVHWFTNLEIKKRHEELILYRSIKDEKYNKYYNFDAINVNKTKEIPIDCDGIMGVPITFMDKYNPDQFEIIGLGISNSGIEIGVKPYTDEHKEYRKRVQKRGAVNGDLYMIIDEEVVVPYARILIKHKR